MLLVGHLRFKLWIVLFSETNSHTYINIPLFLWSSFLWPHSYYIGKNLTFDPICRILGNQISKYCYSYLINAFFVIFYTWNLVSIYCSHCTAYHSGNVVKGINCLCPLKHWSSGFKSTWGRQCCPACKKRHCDGLIPHPRSPTNCLQD
jgi:hypothetical protein